MSSATSILSSLGLGPPNPAAYSDAAAVASQQTQAVNGLKATVAAANSSILLAKKMGVTSTTLDTIQALNAQGTTLLSQASTLTPAALEAKRSKLESELAAAQYAALQEQYVAALTGIQGMNDTIKARVVEIHSDSTTSKGLVSQYDTLLEDVSGSLTLLLVSPPTYAKMNSDASGSSSIPAYIVPSTPSASDYQDRLDTLDGQKEAEGEGEISFTRVFRMIKKWLVVYLYNTFMGIVILSSIILGGIITSNTYIEVEQNYLPNRIFYFIYGALGFPLSIISGCIKPPFWVSTIFPAYPRKPVSQVGGSILGDSFAKLSNAAVAPLKSAGIPVPSYLSDARTATANRIAAANPLAPSPSSSILNIFKESGENHVLHPLSSTDMFSFVLVDAKSPPKYQKDSKKLLWYLSILHASALAGFATSYGLMDKITKIMRAF